MYDVTYHLIFLSLKELTPEAIITNYLIILFTVICESSFSLHAFLLRPRERWRSIVMRTCVCLRVCLSVCDSVRLCSLPSGNMHTRHAHTRTSVSRFPSGPHVRPLLCVISPGRTAYKYDVVVKSLDSKRDNYQVCSVQYCAQRLYTVNCTHIWTELTVLWIGFRLTGPISPCLD